MQKLVQIAGLWLVCVFWAGCRQEPIRVYEIPKERLGAAHAAHLPEGWEQLPASQMRVGSFRVTGSNGATAEVSVIPLPGQADKDLENVNRWRSQVGAAPFSAEQLATNAQPIMIAGQPAQLFEMAGSSVETDQPTRTLGAIQHRQPMSWFFKIMGDDSLVAAQKPAFLDFLASYHFPHTHDEHTHGAPSSESQTDPHAGLDMAAARGQETAPAGNWPIPDSWKQLAAGPMQDARFVARDGKAVITVSRAGGDMLMNVNRWRGQLGLGPLEQSRLSEVVTPLDLPVGKANLVDLSGDSQRMVVVVVPGGQASVFFKMMGDRDAVGAEKDAFIAFVKAVK